MGVLSKDYPAQSISRSSCDPRILEGYAGGQYAVGGTRTGLGCCGWMTGLGFCGCVFCDAATLHSLPTNYVRKTLGELLLEPKACR